MKNVKVIIAIIVYLFINVSFGFSQSREKENVILFVQENIANILDKIPANKEKLYGFENRAEFEDVTIGNAIQFCTIGDSAIIKHLTWRVVVLVNNEYRALVTVQKSSDDFLIGDFGAAVLANDIQQKEIENSINEAKGILRVFSISGDFLILDNDSFIPLTSAEMYLDSKKIKNSSFYTLEEIMNIIKQ